MNDPQKAFGVFVRGLDKGNRVVGTTMDPPKFYCPLKGDRLVRPTEEFAYVGVLTSFDLPNGGSLWFTRMGGLFIDLPDGSAEWVEDDPRAGSFAIDAVNQMNLVLCELALRGQVSSPASIAEIGRGYRDANHAVVLEVLGGREHYWRRTYGVALVGPYEEKYWSDTDEQIVMAARPLALARPLAAVKATLPTYVVSAYSAFSKHMYAEATVLGFVVVEQLMEVMWNEFRLGLPSRRREKLNDRTWTTAARAEVLLEAERMGPDLYDLFETARSHRNNAVHRGQLSPDGANHVVDAVEAMLSKHLGTPVAQLIAIRASV